MRCFVAFDLPQPVRNHLSKVTGPLRERYDIRWVPKEQLHVTVLFAGEIDRDGVDVLAEQVEKCGLPPIELALQTFGVFPPKGIPRVVWAGLGGDVDALEATTEMFAEVGERLELPREKRPFTPHVTLGRVKSRFGVLALIDQLAELSAELKDKPFSVPSLTLYESTLTPRGSRYEVLVRRALETSS
ncbi:MAG: RNA 2',3'-cyclic phosphodiesterase [Planctomycetes bacterium]|nr:RNA 2',3'-cyclic phosphodiesterase [Planctomycetota bacterium]